MKSVKCVYSDNLDISRIANDVENHLKKQTIKIPTLKEELKAKKANLTNGRWSMNCYRAKKEELEELEKEIAEIDLRAKKYKQEVTPIIERWKTCSTTPLECYVTDIDLYIEEFANVTRKYIPITIVRTQISPEDTCTFCGNKSLEENVFSQTLYCTVCKQECIVLSSANGKDVNDDSSGVEEDGTENERIDQMLNRFQGKQPPLPSKVYDEIEIYLNSRGITKQAEIREMIKANPKERCGTSRSLMEEAIKATGNEKFYKDLHLITHVIWGWDLPNFPAELEQQIAADYNLTQKFYPQLREGRRSRLNSDFRIVRHLLTRGYYHPIMNECKLAATQEVLEYHEKTWSSMCQKACLPYVPLSI